MRTQGDSSTLPSYVRLFFAIVGIVVIVGCSLLFVPGVTRPHWPWTIAPFNAAFLGGIYTSELCLVIIAIAVNRWAPIRFILPMALSFVTIVSVVSLFYLGNFHSDKVMTYLWFIAYFGSLLALALAGWRLRHWPADDLPASPGWLRAFLLIQCALLALYGAGLLVIPGRATAFWPWKIDNFHGQVYSAVFLSGALASWLIARAAANVELLALGLTQGSLGLCAIIGLATVDRSLHRVNWSAGGTLLWLAGFAALSLAGLLLIARALLTQPLTLRTATQPG
jgi:hypothetical protein